MCCISYQTLIASATAARLYPGGSPGTVFKHQTCRLQMHYAPPTIYASPYNSTLKLLDKQFETLSSMIILEVVIYSVLVFQNYSLFKKSHYNEFLLCHLKAILITVGFPGESTLINDSLSINRVKYWSEQLSWSSGRRWWYSRKVCSDKYFTLLINREPFIRVDFVKVSGSGKSSGYLGISYRNMH